MLQICRIDITGGYEYLIHIFRLSGLIRDHRDLMRQAALIGLIAHSKTSKNKLLLYNPRPFNFTTNHINKLDERVYNEYFITQPKINIEWPQNIF